MHEHSQAAWAPRVRRVRPVYERHLADHAAGRRRLLSGDEFAVRSVRDGDRQVVAARGELDLSTAWELERELRRAEACGAREILVDLSGLQFVDSAGLGVLIHAAARSRHHSKQLVISPGPQAVHRVFERAGLASLLPFA